MPWATAMPWKSSGEVSIRTSTTRSPRPDPLDRGVGVEHGPADGGARRRVEALGDARRRRPRGRVELVAQELVDVGRLDAAERLFLA